MVVIVVMVVMVALVDRVAVTIDFRNAAAHSLQRCVDGAEKVTGKAVLCCRT